MSLNILVVVGSLRAQSFNRQFAAALIKLPAGEGHTFSFADIGSLPLYNQDDDANPAESVKALKAAISASDGVIFVTPEYNRSFSGVLKNALDHASRPYGQSAWAGKPAAVTGVSPGAVGTALAQHQLRNVLAALDMPTLTAPEAFIQWKDGLVTPEGTVGEASAAFVNKWLSGFIDLIGKYKA